MPSCSLAALAAAIAGDRSGGLEGWLAELPDERARETLRRALELDAPLLARSFASLGSCVVARALAEPSLLPLTRQWTEELEARGEPWVQALRGVPLPVGLGMNRALEELPPGLEERSRLPVAEGVALEVWRTMAPKNPLWPLKVPQERLAWSWRGPEQKQPKRTHGEARFTDEGWGPVSLVRAPGAEPIELPCAEEGTARGSFSEDGALIYVCGSHDEYAGGFVYVLDAATLTLLRSFDTPRPVSEVWGCDREDRLLLDTYGGPALWIDGEVHMIALEGEDGRLSPDGEHIAAGDEEHVTVWSVQELLASREKPEFEGLPVRFDPTGERLVCHRGLYHGRTGERIAELAPRFSRYLEGGPAMPWFQCTERFVINLQSGLQMWSTATGEELESESDRRQDAAEVGAGAQGRGDDEADDDRDDDDARAADDDGADEADDARDDWREPQELEAAAGARSALGMHLPQWYALAYDEVGTTLAAFELGDRVVKLHALPPNGEIGELAFQIAGDVMAMSRDGARIALANELELQVVDRAGKTLRFHDDKRSPDEPINRKVPVRLAFSRDGERVARWAQNAWRIWPVTGGGRDGKLRAGAELGSLPDFADEPPPSDWTVAGSSTSVFTHGPTGAKVAFPAPAGWLTHPRDPRIRANGHAHVVLRSR